MSFTIISTLINKTADISEEWRHGNNIRNMWNIMDEGFDLIRWRWFNLIAHPLCTRSPALPGYHFISIMWTRRQGPSLECCNSLGWALLPGSCQWYCETNYVSDHRNQRKIETSGRSEKWASMKLHSVGSQRCWWEAAADNFCFQIILPGQ